jgi:hypothetical protein
MLDPRLNVERLAARTLRSHSSSSALNHRLESAERGAAGDLDGEVVSVRLSIAEDNLGLLRLAELDSASVPSPPLLVGELGGFLAAAVSVGSGEVIADPFRPTAELVELLHVRASQLRADSPFSARHAREPAQRRWRPSQWRRRGRRRRVPILW